MQLLTTMFLFTIIHGQHQWKQAETMVALASLAKINTNTHEVLVLISTRIGDFNDFFQDISLDNET